VSSPSAAAVNPPTASVGDPGDLLHVDVDAGDVISEIGQAGTRHQADVTRSDDCDFHKVLREWILPRQPGSRER